MPQRGTDVLGLDPAAAYRTSASVLQAAAAEPGVLDRSQETVLGAASGAERVQWRILDLLVHGWDLVEATGVEVELPADLAEKSLTFALIHLPNQPRAGRFADPIAISEAALPIDRLAAFTGRSVP